MDGLVHWDDVEPRSRIAGDIGGRWRFLGEAAGTDGVGLRRFELEAGMRSTAVHVHGAEEEIFYVLAGSGLLWQGGKTCQVGAGDCIVHLAGAEPHTLRGGPVGLDALVFGTRVPLELCYLPRARHAWAGPTVVAAPGLQNLWKYDAEAGPLEFAEPGPRPANVVATARVAGKRIARGDTRSSWRDLGTAAASRRTGLRHVTIDAGQLARPPHCHSAEEEVFIVLEGEGLLTLGDRSHELRRGHVVARPPGTGVAHSFRAGPDGMSLLAYGTREPNDIAYYPRSGKVELRGVGAIGRLQPLDDRDD